VVTEESQNGSVLQANAVSDLWTVPASPPAVKVALRISLSVVALAFGMLFIGQRQISIPGLVPVLITAAFLLNLVSAYVFLGYFRTTRQWPVLFLGAAYLLCSLLALSALAFSMPFTEGGAFSGGAQVLAELWLLGQLGFPALLLVSTLLGYRKGAATTSPSRMNVGLAAVVAWCMACSILPPALLTTFGYVLPALDAQAFYALAKWLALPVITSVTGLVAFRLIREPQRRTTTNLGLFVAVLASWLDSILTLLCVRYSFAWYAGQLFGLVAASAVLGSYIRSLFSIHAGLAGVNKQLQSINQAERVQAGERLAYLAYYDELTALINRSRWRELLCQLIERAKAQDESLQWFAVLFLDLDNFKEVNDAVGHTGGDDLLIEVAKRLRAVLREQDVIGRLGGDEFAILLPQLQHSREAEQIAARMLATLREPFGFYDRTFEVSASIGISYYPVHGTSSETLLHHSDVALYSAKRKGGNCYNVYMPAMGEQSDRRIRLKESLIHAVRRHEFALQYQPLFDLRTGRVDSAEALIRWHHPEKGTIMPGTFIGFAEESGLMQSIGRWTLEAASAQIRLWNAMGGPELKISANVSVKQLQDRMFFDHLRETLEQNAVAPWQLELELTESVAMADSALTFQLLCRLRELGVTIALDDFGTHYSSLTNLRQLPIDTLKIDRTFVSGLPLNRDDAVIVRSVIALAHDLGQTVVAEGVETREQLEWLREMSCDIVQGYLIEKPMTADRFTDWRGAQLFSAA